MASGQSTSIRRLSQAELARELGVSRQAIGKHVSAGTIPMDSAGKIDVDLAKRALADRVRPSGKTASASMATSEPAASAPVSQTATADYDQASTSYHVARTLRESEEAKMAKLKRLEIEGTLIRLDAVKSALASVIASTRDSLLQLPARLAPVLAAETSAAKVHDIIQAEIHQALAQLTAAPARLADKDTAQ